MPSATPDPGGDPRRESNTATGKRTGQCGGNIGGAEVDTRGERVGCRQTASSSASRGRGEQAVLGCLAPAFPGHDWGSARGPPSDPMATPAQPLRRQSRAAILVLVMACRDGKSPYSSEEEAHGPLPPEMARGQPKRAGKVVRMAIRQGGRPGRRAGVAASRARRTGSGGAGEAEERAVSQSGLGKKEPGSAAPSGKVWLHLWD
jgi:hypothetical protein